MWFRTLFDTLLARTSRTRLRKTPPAPSVRRRSRSLRLLLEILEDRTLLSTYVVDSLTDTGKGSGLDGDLRYCVTHATSGSDTITFQQGLTGAIDLESALPTLNASVAIQGPGGDALAVAGGFVVGSSATVTISGLLFGGVTNSGTLTLSDCNFTGGNLSDITNSGTLTVSACNFHTLSGDGVITNSGTATVSDSAFSGGLQFGGGAGAPDIIDNSGTMAISNSAFEGFFFYLPIGNDAVIGNSGALTVSYSTLSGNYGRAIFNQGALRINNSTLNNNGVEGSDVRSGTTVIGYNGMGGGIYMDAGTLSINSSTLEGNAADGGGGGTPQGSGYGTATGGQGGNGLGGALYIAGGTVSINNSTLAYNQANNGSVYNGSPGAGYGGGIYNAAGPGALQMYDTILADNSATTADPDLDGSLTSLGYNLIGNSTGGSGFAASDLLNVNPQLGPLQNNGGPTYTMALLAGSPAINAGDNTNAPAYDQRGPGYPRIVGGTIDIGAFEVQSGTTNQPSSFSVSGFPSSITAGTAHTFTVKALNADGSIDTSYTGTVQFTSSDPKAKLPINYTFTAADAGVHTFSATLKTAGTQTLTVADTTTTSVTGTEGNITVHPATASKFLLSAPASVSAGVAFSLTVTVVDAYGNVVSGYRGTVHFSSSDKSASLPANYTFSAADAGVHTFTGLVLYTKGHQKIRVTGTHDSALTGTDSISVV